MSALLDEHSNLQKRCDQLQKALKLLTGPFRSDDLVVAKIVKGKTENNLVITIKEDMRGSYKFIDMDVFEMQGTERNKVAWMHVQKFRGSLKITDIRSMRENVGISSILLNTLFQFIDYRNQRSKEAEVNAKFNNPFMFSTIYGDLSWIDRENMDLLYR